MLTVRDKMLAPQATDVISEMLLDPFFLIFAARLPIALPLLVAPEVRSGTSDAGTVLSESSRLSLLFSTKTTRPLLVSSVTLEIRHRSGLYIFMEW